jgi:hypothetical protein
MKPPHDEISLRKFLVSQGIDVKALEESVTHYQSTIAAVVSSTHHFDDPQDFILAVDYFDALTVFLEVLAWVEPQKINDDDTGAELAT